jgi:photosystem P840 reaction center protein PscD
MSVWRTGNAVHTVDKYFITNTARDQNGRLKLTISSAGGYGQLTNTNQIIDLIKSGEMNLMVLTTNPNIAVDVEGAVKANEERYVTDFDNRGVRCTVREMVVFVNPSTNELSVEFNGNIMALEQFFK